MVNDYEQAHDTTDLWKKVNAASKAILSKSYECGMMSKATFDKISDMYDFTFHYVVLTKRPVLKHTHI